MSEAKTSLLEERGHFWWHGEAAPKSPYATPFGVPGILTIGQDGRARLNVMESLLKRRFLDIAATERSHLDGNPEALKGKAIAGKIHGQSRCVYLRKLQYRSLGRSVDGKSTEEFHADLSIVGYTTTSRAEKSLRFSDLSISLAGLEEWRWSDVLIVGEEKQDGENRSRTVTYSVPLRKYELKEGALSFQSDVHCSAHEGVSYREIQLSQHDSLDYRRKQATTAEAMQQEFTHIEQFLALLTGTYYSLEWPQVSIEHRGQLERYRLFFLRDVERDRKPQMTNLWTTFPQLQLNFGRLYENWREKRRKYGPGFYLFLGSLRSREMYIEHRFANLVWGVESLHRGMTTPPGVSKSHRKRIDSILAKTGTELSGDERKWLISERNKRIEPALAQRIFSTFKGLPWKVTETTLRSFAEKCAARRNDLSHFGGPRTRREDYNLFLRELMKLTAGLTHMYHAALLQEVGVDGKVLLDCAKRPIGSRIRHDLKLARLETKEMTAEEPPNMDELQKLQREALRKWRRRQTRAMKKRPELKEHVPRR